MLSIQDDHALILSSWLFFINSDSFFTFLKGKPVGGDFR